jgi:hypothetical protein
VSHQPPEQAARFVDGQVAFVEERRRATETVLWQLPSVSIAAQSFLLAAGLNPEADDWARIVVGILGAFAAFATGLVVAYQAVRATVLTRWVQQRMSTSVAPEVLGGQVPLNRVQKRVLRLKGPLETWAVILIAFLLADLFVLAKGTIW